MPETHILQYSKTSNQLFLTRYYSYYRGINTKCIYNQKNIVEIKISITQVVSLAHPLIVDDDPNNC